ncbi:unnamed protein product [Allacma fusca]|uniref:Uncharacterized protein n=1 Tax=Allacma fusca TaxID=39272 RepID=A0A8J2JFU6_9HEXA|nr:unnamed protein product [Allacma fusca]
MQSKIQMLAQKISNERPTISQWQFVTLDRHMLKTIVTSMTTYLIILIQFQISDRDRNSHAYICTCPAGPYGIRNYYGITLMQIRQVGR